MSTRGTLALEVLSGYCGSIVARSILQGAAASSGVDIDWVTTEQLARLVPAIESGVRTFSASPEVARECCDQLRVVLEQDKDPLQAGGSHQLRVEILAEYDVVVARNHAKTAASEMGFGASEQIKIATVVSELARNIFQYAGQGYIDIRGLSGEKDGVEVTAKDNGCGIQDVDTVLSGGYQSKTGMGIGLIGARRLMDDFEIDTKPGIGTRVVVRKYLR
jgi:serine/threonine-protein kinase RsbT